MYNPLWKYYIKGLIGRKNTSWYADKLSYAYMRNNNVNDDFSVWADNQSIIEDELISNALSGICPKGFELNPLFYEGFHLRESSLQSNKNKHSCHPFKFFIQLPETSFSMGGHSWFYSLGMSLKHQGLEVDFFWGDNYQFNFNNQVENIIISSYNQLYLDSLNQSYIIDASNYFRIRVGFTFPNHENNQHLISNFINKFTKFSNIFFYTFYDLEYFNNSNFINTLNFYNIPLYSLPFAANPIYHFPAPFIQDKFDYIFLGSSNYEKVDRYYSYFYPIINNFKGYIGGPGWDWEKDFIYNPKRDKYMYASAKVALNLHIVSQIQHATELNERTYILSACGQTQIIDNAALLSKMFNSYFSPSLDSFDYFSKISDSISSYPNYYFTKDLMKYTFKNHLTFNRTDVFINKLLLLS